MGLAHGIVGWADVAVPDMAGGSDFYTRLFGWEADEAGPSDSMPYVMFRKDGKTVAGMGPQSDDQVASGAPPSWSTYVIVDDVDEIHARGKELGATALMEPMQIMDSGRMTFLMDPVGAVIGFWQSGTHDGAEVFNVPGAITWNEVATRDIEATRAFYTTLLGWESEDMDMGDNGMYTTFKNQGRMNGGAYDMSGFVPDEVPPHWVTWFLVDDTAAMAARAVELGGTVVREPEESGGMIPATISDPFGATFGIISSDQVDGQPER